MHMAEISTSNQSLGKDLSFSLLSKSMACRSLFLTKT
jgi:hypothetical protein